MGGGESSSRSRPAADLVLVSPTLLRQEWGWTTAEPGAVTASGRADKRSQGMRKTSKGGP